MNWIGELLFHLGPVSSTGGTFWLPPAASVTAKDVDPLFYLILYVTTFFFVLVIGSLVYFMVKYRDRGDDVRTSGLKGNTKLEIAWSVIPGLILMIFFVWGAKAYLDIMVPPADAMNVNVQGQKWSWTFSYPSEGVVSSGVMVVPSGRNVKMTIHSVDVVHSFYVPDFRIKADAIPGRYTLLWFNAPEVGEHQVFCAEYCGDNHSKMLATIKVVPEAEYAKWLEENAGAGATPVEQGEKLFAVNCASCHSTEGKRIVGPPLNGIFGKTEKLEGGRSVVVDENYIRKSLVEPAADVVEGYPAVMTPFTRLKESEITALIEYIKSLSGGASGDAAAGAAEGGGADAAPAAAPEQPADVSSSAVTADDPVSRGKALFAAKACVGCHSTTGARLVGPHLDGIVGTTVELEGGATVTVDRGYLRESISDPNAKVVKGFPPAMPPVPGLTDQELDDLIAYIESLTESE